MNADLRLGDWKNVMVDVDEVQTMLVDTPYGARTHAGHDAGVDLSKDAHKGPNRDRSYGKARRRKLGYEPWDENDVCEFVEHWAPRTRGWFCAFSCSDLSPIWRNALEEQGRCTFAPIPCIIPGMTVRQAGDGPSNWTCYLNVARPRGIKEFVRWGTLPGHYRSPRGTAERLGMERIGGKPRWLTGAIIRDYSRIGDLICDPCAGYATTAVSALEYGRRFIGAEIDAETYEKAKRRLSEPRQQAMFAERAPVIPREQQKLFGDND